MDSKDFFSKEDIYNDVVLYSYQNPVKHIDDYAFEDLTRFFRNYWIKERRLDSIWRIKLQELRTEGEKSSPLVFGQCLME